MQSTEVMLKKPNENDESIKTKNAIINVLQSYYGAFKIIYTIVQYKPNLERCPAAKPYWDMIQNELGESIHRAQIEMKELDMVLQTFHMLASQLKGFKTDIVKYSLSTVLNNSYPAVRALNNETIPKCFGNISRIQGISLDKCKENFNKILPLIGAENFLAQQEELTKLKEALNMQIEAKNGVLSSDQYIKLSKAVEMRKVSVAKNEVKVPALESDISELTRRQTSLESELEEIENNKDAYIDKFESTFGEIDESEKTELENLLNAQVNEQTVAKSRWDERISETQNILKAIEEKIIDPDNGFVGGLKKCLNLAKPFLTLWNPIFATQSFDTGSKEPTAEELMALSEKIQNQQKTFVELSIQESESIEAKYEKYTEKVKNKYNQLKATADKMKENREAGWKIRKEDLTNELTEVRKELKDKKQELTTSASDLAADREQLKSDVEVFQDYIKTNMEDKQRYINKLREDIKKQEDYIFNDLQQLGQSTPQTAYYFLNAVQEMSRVIQVNIQLMGGASNFTTTSMITIKSHFASIEEIISKPDDNPRFWMGFLKYLNEIYEGLLKCTWAALKNFTSNPSEENFAKLGLNHPDYSEDLKTGIKDYYSDYKDQNNPLDQNEKKKKDIEINCDKLFNVFNFSSLAKELEELK